MREWGLAIEGGLLLGCVWGLLAICLGVLAYHVTRSWAVWRRRRRSLALSLLACAAIIVGGTKPRVTVDDPYIRDAGSYVTNDFVHVAVVARFDFIPATTEVLIFSRELEQTNAADWVQLTRIEEGPYKLGEFPLDIPFANATNYNFMVAANYIPAPTVHTNGVWSIKGFIVPGTATNDTTGMLAFPNTKTIKRED